MLHDGPPSALAPLPDAMTPLQRLIASGRVVRPPTARLEDLGPPLPASRRVIAALHRALEGERAERVLVGR